MTTFCFPPHLLQPNKKNQKPFNFLNFLRAERFHLLQRILSSSLCIFISDFCVMYCPLLCRSCRSRYQAVVIFSLTKKKKGGRCLKSLQLNSYKSALAVVLQRNLCKALLSLNSFAVVGWLSEEQLSSIRHVFLREQSPPTHHTYPPPGGGF